MSYFGKGHEIRSKKNNLIESKILKLIKVKEERFAVREWIL